MEHVHEKQQAVLDKLKQKRANSLAAVTEITPTASEEESKATVNIKKIEVPKQTEEVPTKASDELKSGSPKEKEKSPQVFEKADPVIKSPSASDNVVVTEG